MFNFSGKSAIITGASQGIGQAIAVALDEAGANLVLIGRDLKRLEASAAHLTNGTERPASFIEADLLDPASLSAAARRISSMCKTVDILINCGGSYARGGWDQTSPEAFNELLQANVTGPYALTRALLPGLLQARGDIVFVNSSITRSPGHKTGHFKSSQHALQALADSLRTEFNELGVRVMSIYPGRTATPRQASIHVDEDREYRPESLLQPADVANAVLSCLSLPETAEVTDLYIRPRLKT